ncbi:hypothetical protein ACP4OV_004663 [Aristida adscensionis]
MTTAATGGEPFPAVDKCDASRLGAASTVASDLDGTLLRSPSAFPYYALVAFEAGGAPRLALLLLLAPLAAALRRAVSEPAALRVLVFAATAGARVADIESTARAVLVVTATPRVMAEPFLRDQLGADAVAGTELATWRGRATGWVDARRGVLAGERKAEALREMVGDGGMPDVGLGDRRSDYAFMTLCKEAYLVPGTPVEAVRADELRKRVVFHDGRLVQRPTPLVALLTVAWLPVGLPLSLARVAAGVLLPMPWLRLAFWALGVRVVVQGAPPPPPPPRTGGGVLFACCHRTLLDAVFLSVALRRPVAASPTRCPASPSSWPRSAPCGSPATAPPTPPPSGASSPAATSPSAPRGPPAGSPCCCASRRSSPSSPTTSCRWPICELGWVAPPLGTTARGWKGMDPFYFFMNPRPAYTVTYLDKLPAELTCGAGGRSSHEVANHVQKLIASTLSYECTGLTRKDKYRALAGNDGVVAVKRPRSHIVW